ncbi:MAG: guanylate kinase [Bacteroidota bacterium]
MPSISHKALIFAGPSGSGKTTIARYLLENNGDLGFSVSACTRAKRPQEIHGKDYYFLSVDEFKRKIEQEAFIEWEEVYEGRYYGTLKTEVANLWKAGKVAVFDMDVQGALRLKSYFEEDALAVYVQVPSLSLLARRLIKRKTEPAEELVRRIGKAEQEASSAAQFDVVLINEQLKTSLCNAWRLADEFLKR